ncbi:hypothetical protein J4418_03135 [Candidatus Woesearchaeota archaeon]|nr:hypothetical protein [Candidatus Woesearchaeota archaeon]
MKKSAILLIGIVLLVTIIGCSKSAPIQDNNEVQQSAQATTPAIDSEIKEVDQLNQELDTSELDTLESDLDIEI